MKGMLLLKRKEVSGRITKLGVDKFFKTYPTLHNDKLNKKDMQNMIGISNYKIEQRYGNTYEGYKCNKLDYGVIAGLFLLSAIIFKVNMFFPVAFIAGSLIYLFIRTKSYKFLANDVVYNFIFKERVKLHYTPKLNDFKLIAMCYDEEGILNIIDTANIPKDKSFGKYKLYIADKETLSTMVKKHIKGEDFDVDSMTDVISENVKNYYFAVVNKHDSLSTFRDLEDSKVF